MEFKVVVLQVCVAKIAFRVDIDDDIVASVRHLEDQICLVALRARMLECSSGPH